MKFHEEFNASFWAEDRVGYITGALRLVGTITMLAFAASMMPSDWFIWISEKLGQPFPAQPIGFYLARNLSAMYGFVGAGLLVIAANIQRYGPLVYWISAAAIAFGTMQLALDAWAGLPWWWTIAEGLSTVLGGMGLLALISWCRDSKRARKDA